VLANGDLLAGTDTGGVCRSTDNADSWFPLNNGLTGMNVYALLELSPGILFAATGDGGLCRSLDDGNLWERVDASLPENSVYAVVANHIDHLFACTHVEGLIYRSQDVGDTWEVVSDGFPEISIRSLGFDQLNRLLVGTSGLGVVKSVQTTPVFPTLITATRDPSGIVTVHWQVADPGAAGFYDVYRQQIGVAGDDTDGGERSDHYTKLTGSPLWGGPWFDFVDASAPAEECTYWIRFTSAQAEQRWFGPAVAAAMPIDQIGLRLETVWPNPVRNHTTIRFNLPQSGPVELAVYDLRGRLVRRLVRDTRMAGPGQVEWSVIDDAGNRVSAGVYLLRLETVDGVVTRKTLVLRDAD
jgi:hypothetical protein